MRRISRAAAVALATSSFLASTASAQAPPVPECEAFIAKYTQCINAKVPEAQRSDALAAIDALRKMVSMAGLMNQQDPKVAADLCKGLQDEVKKQTDSQGFGCAW
jgi:dienelactone hydrolase